MDLVEKVDIYLTEEDDSKSEFYSWLKKQKEVTCTIIDGGMILAVCKGHVKVSGGSIPEFSVWGGKAEINFRYAAANYKPRRSNGWLIEAKSKKLTYEVY